MSMSDVVVLLHPNEAWMIMNDAAFVPVAQYGAHRTTVPHEIGYCRGIRYVAGGLDDGGVALANALQKKGAL